MCDCDKKLSDQLRQADASGDFGKALEGYADRAKALEDGILEAIGWNWLDDDAPHDIRKRLLSLVTG